MVEVFFIFNLFKLFDIDDTETLISQILRCCSSLGFQNFILILGGEIRSGDHILHIGALLEDSLAHDRLGYAEVKQPILVVHRFLVVLLLLLAEFENIDLGLFLGTEFYRANIFKFLVVAVVFEDREFRIERSGSFDSLTTSSIVSAQTSILVNVVTQHDSLRRRRVSKRTAVEDVFDVLLFVGS